MNETQNNEIHVCGVLVQSRPDDINAVEAGLLKIPGVEIHDRAEDGRLIVTIEDTEDAPASSSLADVYKVDGVLGASLVYHQWDVEDDQPSEGITS